ncbi:alanyl-tRNA editing protein Aarsd1-B [Sitophilus oryzae]|uniref:Alanyl-tRNA editing protein Aarsd1-B n=1 Tax=Sitophilus oryzae TaxID=7048 RepID=A0A6J2Y027_SITOR|nr:alanyl-tRNA editing protein Aarsd1-B [Sitophilus oryzae]
MVFKCQSDSYLKEFTSKVISCNKINFTENTNGKSTTSEAYEVTLEDTILFPEGGGQPCDYGTLNNVPVVKVVRREDIAVHITKEPLNVGDEVLQKISWERRFDHMQQHSGQHLITAIIDRKFNIPTVSWYLGEDVSYIELDATKISTEQITDAENEINDLIRQGKKVTVDVYTEDTPEELLKEARSARGLPEDHKGGIRVIRIEDVEGNMCCGTHVTNLGQLQVVKLLHSEKSKRKDKTFLYFLVGNRVVKRLSLCIDREEKLGTLLKNNPSQHPELVEKLQKNLKTLTKNVQSVLKDLATLEAKKLNDMLPIPSYFSMHRREAEPDFMNTFVRELGDRKDILLFLSTGDEKQVGNIVVYGAEKDVSILGPKICELLGGKGAGKGNKYQAKVSNMANRNKVEELIANYFKE